MHAGAEAEGVAATARSSSIIGFPRREIREDEKELIHLDATRTRFGETLSAGLEGGDGLEESAHSNSLTPTSPASSLPGEEQAPHGESPGDIGTNATTMARSAAALEHTLLGWLV